MKAQCNVEVNNIYENVLIEENVQHESDEEVVETTWKRLKESITSGAGKCLPQTQRKKIQDRMTDDISELRKERKPHKNCQDYERLDKLVHVGKQRRKCGKRTVRKLKILRTRTSIKNYIKLLRQ